MEAAAAEFENFFGGRQHPPKLFNALRSFSLFRHLLTKEVLGKRTAAADSESREEEEKEEEEIWDR